MRIYDVTVEYQRNPLGLDVRVPRFSWKLESKEKGDFQKAYQIQISRLENFQVCDCWDTGKVISGDSVQVEYAGEPLEKFTLYYIRVKVWDEKGQESEWSDTAQFETAMLSCEDWSADWITPDYDYTAPKTACPVLRKEFETDRKVKRARVYVTAKGLYELRLNGKKVGSDFLTPGWTAYNKRTMYQTYDVTDMIAEGGNAIGATIGSGWYKGELGWRSRRNLYGGREALILELHLTYEDGGKDIIVTDDTWQSTYRGPVVYSEIYHGETYDSRREIDFDKYGCSFRHWFGVRVMGAVTKENLIAQECPPVREKLVIKPVKLIITPRGEQVLDMGQEMTGHVRFHVKGNRGDRVILCHGEILDREGNFYTENLKGAKQRIEYILKDEAEAVFQPHFTYQGFRYVKIEAYPGEIHCDDFEGAVLYSDLKQTGFFETTNNDLRQLTQNIFWGQRGNFVDIPTDCPQRCERLGWTGDIQIFAGTAALNMEIPLFLRKWLHDLKAEQFESGGVPWVVPDIYDDTYAYDLAGYTGQSEKTAAAWGDASTICPWSLYMAYGDKRILEEQFESMCKYVEFIRKQGPQEYTWEGGHQLGDWVALDAPYGSFVGATDVDYVATAFYAKSAEILSKAAKIIGKWEEHLRYKELHEKIVEAFQQLYVEEDGSLKVKTQTALILAAEFELVPEHLAKKYSAQLAQSLKETNYDLITGFVGTPYICHVLSRYGHGDAAYKLLFKREYPSWMYQVTQGATTVWEHLDGIRPDGTLWNPRMNSFNHYAYGSVAEWIFREIAGLQICENEPGYKRFLIRPCVGEQLEDARFTYESMYGTIVSGWEKMADGIKYEITVPVNTTAEVYVQGNKILQNGRAIHDEEGIHIIEKDDKGCLMELAGGTYEFIAG
ncbi:MAG: family 78 glycoside hydrolase catalytic domain [Eubacteriales bacterium]|nr:family 78 glycoside hydrolase catalytic domain [Eubacteriales bacterium]